MRRREFITLLGSTALAWPLAARAQQSAMPVIGVLWPGTSPPGYPRMESFTQALRQLGFIEGQNVAIELRYARGGPQQLQELAAELVLIKVDVLATFGDLTPKIAQQATGTIPIVAISDDINWSGNCQISVSARHERNRTNDHGSGTQRKTSGGPARDGAPNIACGGSVGPHDWCLASRND